MPECAAQLAVLLPIFRFIPWNTGNRLTIGVDIASGGSRIRAGTPGLKQNHRQKKQE